jgi:hypothetical protein
MYSYLIKSFYHELKIFLKSMCIVFTMTISLTSLVTEISSNYIHQTLKTFLLIGAIAIGVHFIVRFFKKNKSSTQPNQ